MDSEHPSGSTVPPASPGHPRRPGDGVRTLGRVLAVHWGKILVIWALVTGSLVFVIWNRVRPAYETYSLLRIEPPVELLGKPGAAAEWQPFLQTQVELIRSPRVLNAALTKNEVAATRAVREAKDPQGDIHARLQVHVLPGTYLIRVNLMSPYPRDSSAIVNEVITQYLAIASNRGAARITLIEPARTPRTPVKDARWKLATMAPVWVLAVVLSLFLVPELWPGAVVGRSETPLRPADDAGAPFVEP